MMRVPSLLTAALMLAAAPVNGAEMRGHGGPVRALAVAPGGAVITGSFDTKAIVWSLETGTAREVLLFHAGQVNAVAALREQGFATGGAGRTVGSRSGNWVRARPCGPSTAMTVASMLAFLADGTLVNAGYDANLIVWWRNGTALARVAFPDPLNTLVTLPGDRLALGGADGALAGDGNCGFG